MGKSSMEGFLQYAIDSFLSKLPKNGAKSFDFAETMHRASSNIITNLVFGERFDHDDPEFNTLLSAIKRMMELTMKAMVFKNIPIIGWLPGDITGSKELAEKNDYVYGYVLKKIKEHQDNLSNLEPEDIQCYIDQYLLEMPNRTDPHEGFNSKKLISNLLYHQPTLYLKIDTKMAG